jgi:hypothetical protein
LAQHAIRCHFGISWLIRKRETRNNGRKRKTRAGGAGS